jgi:chitin synthase
MSHIPSYGGPTPPPGPHPRRSQLPTSTSAPVGYSLHDGGPAPPPFQAQDPYYTPPPRAPYDHFSQPPAQGYAPPQQWNQQSHHQMPQGPSQYDLGGGRQGGHDPFREQGDEEDEPELPLLSSGGAMGYDTYAGGAGGMEDRYGGGYGGYAAQGHVPGAYEGGSEGYEMGRVGEREEESQIRYGKIPQRQPRRYKTVKREWRYS